MTVTITDTTPNPSIIPSGKAVTPYGGVTVADTAPLSTTETVTVTLSQSQSNNPGQNYSFYPTATNLGTISDPNGGGTFDPNTGTFTESGVIGGDPTFATSLLRRLVYTAPSLPAGQGFATQAKITVTDNGVATSDSNPVIVGVVTPPAITGTIANEPIASGGKIPPFATVSLSNPNFSYYYYTIPVASGFATNYSSYYYNAKDTATIMVMDGGRPTDADGLLTGPGLSKTGVGTYGIVGDYPYNVQSFLRALSFQPTEVAAGKTANPSFELDVTDSQTGLTTKDTTTSLLVIGPAITPLAPSIAGTQAGQSVAPGNHINPFAAVTISDANLNPTDTVTITVTDASGKATDANGTFVPAAGLTETGTGIYTLAASDPASLTAEIDHLTFDPAAVPTGQTSVTTSLKIDVTDTGVSKTATDTKTTIIEMQPPSAPPSAPVNNPSNNFLVHDETTGQVYSSAGETYNGPVVGLTNDIILATSDNINVNAEVPNVFIKTGGGDDAIDVSAVNGNNVMDGSTGSNFLTGGSGSDTFFVDDRNASADIWSTVNGFHAGDAATIWGVRAQDFGLSWVDGQGASGFTGLTLHATAPGKPIASLTLAGYTSADLSNGRLSVSFGAVDGNNYMYVQGTS